MQRTVGVTEPPSTTTSATANDVLVVGLGEVGAPIMEVLSSAHHVTGRDIVDVEVERVEILHVCYPFTEGFVNTTREYVARYRPAVVVVNSTVVPGTSRAIELVTRTPTVYSPVRGKHTEMTAELRRYVKFVAGSDEASVASVESHFRAAGITTARMAPTAQLELAKLLETSYFGVLIAWAQEMDRFSAAVGGDYWDLFAFFDEIDVLPRARFEPGFIGGHCVMPNLELLQAVRPSVMAAAIHESNRERELEVLRSGGSTTVRRRPRMP